MGSDRFSIIFQLIKKYYGNKGAPESDNRFQAICEGAGIPMIRLGFYLKTLEDIGLISYSEKAGFIKLTSFGKKVEHLFK